MLTILIPMAGLGTRFSSAGYTLQKPLLPLLPGLTLIESVLTNVAPDNQELQVVLVNNTKLIPTAELRKLPVVKARGPWVKIVEVDSVPPGPAASAFIAEKFIDPKSPLIITNCDQMIEDFDLPALESFAETFQADGILGCFLSSSPKNSYVQLNGEGDICLVKEKQVISNIATNGLHYWKSAELFFWSAAKMISSNDSVNGEYYIAPSYNYLCTEGYKVLPFFYNLHFPVGIPEDYEKYLQLRGLK